MASPPRVAPHRPQWRAAGADDLPGHLEPAALVARAGAGAARFQVGPQTVVVAALQHRLEQRGADPLALPVRLHADEGQIPVRPVLGVLRLEQREQAKGTWQIAPVDARHRRQQAELAQAGYPPSAGREPHRPALHSGRGPAVADPEVDTAQPDREGPLELLVAAARAGRHPPGHGVVVEGPCQRSGELGKVVPIRGTDGLRLPRRLDYVGHARDYATDARADAIRPS